MTRNDRDELELLTTTEVAALFHLSTRTVQRMIATGEIPTVKVGGARRIRAEVARRIARGDPATVAADEHQLAPIQLRKGHA